MSTPKTVYMNLQHQPFEWIRSGAKKYELRLWDEKRREINIGDTIAFWHDDKNNPVLARVVGLVVAETFEKLFDIIPFNRCICDDSLGLTPKNNGMDKYYPIDAQREYNVVAIKVELI